MSKTASAQSVNTGIWLVNSFTEWAKVRPLWQIQTKIGHTATTCRADSIPSPDSPIQASFRASLRKTGVATRPGAYQSVRWRLR